MKTIIFFALLVASTNCQQSAFESFMSRNRELFPNLSTGSSQFATSGQQQPQPQIQHQWQQPAPAARSNQFVPSLPSNEPFVTSNSHIQSFNQPQSFSQPQSFNQPQAFNQLSAPTGPTTTISGPNFQTSINLPAIPSLPQHATQSAPQQQQQQQPQFQHQFTSHIHSHQIPSSSAPLVNQPSTGLASASFFNNQGNNNFPNNFASPSAPSSLPTPPQTFGPLDFSSFQGNSFFNNQQQTASPSTPSSFTGTNAIRAPGFETFVYMRPSEQPVQGASLRKVIRSPNGIDKELFYVPMPSYSPPSIYTTQVIHGNENKQGQQQ